MPNDILDRFLSFLDASPTPQHAVQTGASQLAAHGFQAYAITDTPRLSPGDRGFIAKEGSLFAFVVGRESPTDAGWRIAGAHTDSPNLRIKPQPHTSRHGYVRLAVEPYGGLQIATWVDRDLGIAGAVHVRHNDGVRTELVDLRRPLARIPTLAIHLNRDVNEKGLKLNRQTQLPAVFSLDGDDAANLKSVLAEEIGVDECDILTWDLSLYDLTPARLGGASNEFVFSARLDNLASCHAGLEALIASAEQGAPRATSVLGLFDHEEIGSESSRGAASRSIDDMLTWLSEASDQPLNARAAHAHTWVLSVDMSHAKHPGFPDKSDHDHAPIMNGGPAIKQNVNQRYATEGAGAAAFQLLCERAGVPCQWYVHRSDLACGSTVGPMLASRLGARTLDVGNPMLSMHSCREQAGARDHALMTQAITQFFVDDLA